ncbi:hypothetical protein D3C84_527920 [compost metagenome]
MAAQIEETFVGGNVAGRQLQQLGPDLQQQRFIGTGRQASLGVFGDADGQLQQGLTIDLAVAGKWHARQFGPGGGLHVVRQKLGGVCFQRFTRRAGQRFLRLGEERQNPPLAVDDHGHLAVQLTVAQATFDLLRLDPKAANLYLIVPAAAQLDAGVGPLRHVTGAVGPQVLTARQAHVQIALGGLLRIVQIAQADTGPDDVQLADGLFAHRLKILVEDQHLTVGNRRTEGAIAVAGAQLPRGDQHRRFGRAIEVVEVALAGELLDDIGFAHIATGHHMIQHLQLLQRQNAQQGWWQKRVAQALVADQFHQLQRITALIIAGHDQLGALQQGRENIDQRRVETQRRKLQRPALLRQLHIVGVPRGEVREVGLAEQHAFGMASGAGGVERHARRIEVRALAHQRLIEIHAVEGDRADVQAEHLGCKRMLPVVQQQHRTGIRQNVVLTLQRMARLQRQIHRAAAENRQNPRIQRTAFRQANADHPRPVELFEHWLQTLLDGAAVSMQLAIAEGRAGKVQRRSFGGLHEALFKPLDHRHLRELQQPRISGGIEPMDEGQALQEPQAFQPLEMHRGRWLGQ